MTVTEFKLWLVYTFKGNPDVKWTGPYKDDFKLNEDVPVPEFRKLEIKMNDESLFELTMVRKSD